MRVLLDTHTFLWWTLDDARLSKEARDVLEDPQAVAFLSAVSVWEIAIKSALGKLRLHAPLARIVVEEPDRNGLISLPITREHACRISELPPLHGDPFDRLLVAQAQLEELVLLTRDPMVSAYPVQTLW